MPSASDPSGELQARHFGWLTRRRVIDFGRWASCAC